jgi:hypothetical protein
MPAWDGGRGPSTRSGQPKGPNVRTRHTRTLPRPARPAATGRRTRSSPASADICDRVRTGATRPNLNPSTCSGQAEVSQVSASLGRKSGLPSLAWRTGFADGSGSEAFEEFCVEGHRRRAGARARGAGRLRLADGRAVGKWLLQAAALTRAGIQLTRKKAGPQPRPYLVQSSCLLTASPRFLNGSNLGQISAKVNCLLVRPLSGWPQGGSHKKTRARHRHQQHRLVRHRRR